MTSSKESCLYCDRTAEEVPLISIQFRNQDFFICPQHLPVLIHKPEQLADKLPGAEDLKPAEGHHH